MARSSIEGLYNRKTSSVSVYAKDCTMTSAAALVEGPEQYAVGCLEQPSIWRLAFGGREAFQDGVIGSIRPYFEDGAEIVAAATPGCSIKHSIKTANHRRTRIRSIIAGGIKGLYN